MLLWNFEYIYALLQISSASNWKKKLKSSLHIFWARLLEIVEKKDFVHLSSMKKEIDRKSHPFIFDLRYTIRALLTGSSLLHPADIGIQLFLKQLSCSPCQQPILYRRILIFFSRIFFFLLWNVNVDKHTNLTPLIHHYCVEGVLGPSCLISNPGNSANTDSIRQAKERSYPWNKQTKTLIFLGQKSGLKDFSGLVVDKINVFIFVRIIFSSLQSNSYAIDTIISELKTCIRLPKNCQNCADCGTTNRTKILCIWRQFWNILILVLLLIPTAKR